MSEKFLEGLNERQLEAVRHVDGPILVLAGAGTGKTKVLTSRIAYLISNSYAYPSEILAVTFTNKAAKEMMERVTSTVESAGIWLGTFHAINLRILRRHANLLGISEDFFIIDADDQLRLIKNIIKDKNYDDKQCTPKVIANVINRWKDMALSPEQVDGLEHFNKTSQIARNIYHEYQSRLKILSSLDFGDLLLKVIELFNSNSDILEFYQDKFKFILVDEYQDTNVCQYLWLKLLAGKRRNICCVGDEDQSIYSWRGAEIDNILRFEKDFPGAKLVKLEQNYRSTANILEAASNLIANNHKRLGKILWTKDDCGEPVTVNEYYNDLDEAGHVAQKISFNYGVSEYENIAVLVRAGFQTRLFEEAFISRGINYRIFGGMRFYDRAEIKDVIAYIRVAVLKNDDLALERIINTPKRAIGAGSLLSLRQYANEHNISLFDAAKAMLQSGEIKNRVGRSLALLIEQFEKYHAKYQTENHVGVTEDILKEVGYLDMWRQERTMESETKLENVKELLRALEDFSSIREFLEHVSLVSDTDQRAQAQNNVTLMTIHAAKGLEFDVVFLVGWEEGVFPHQRAIDENGAIGLEEERRLAYVAITRARKIAHISYARSRRIYGQFQGSIPSRFLAEINLRNVSTSITSGCGPSADEYNQVVEKVTPQVGQYVSHPKFGRGKIVATSADSLTISFQEFGTKTILKSYVNIN